MQNPFSGAISFIKGNLSIVYSLFLIIFIPAAFLINNYITNSSYEDAINQITQRKAVLIENIINSLLQSQTEDVSVLQSAIERVMKNNNEIISLSILKSQNESGGFLVIASNDKNLIGQRQDESIQNILAWSQPEGIAYLDKNQNGRFWSVTKSFLDNSDKKIGLIKMDFSIKNTDELIHRIIYSSFWILIVTILLVVLLVANQARLLGYALTVTKLKEIDKMKDMFISMASHELRSPLSAIKGYISMLQEKKNLKLDEESKNYIKNISLSSERLDELVADILEVSRIEGNRLPIEFSVFNPHPVILRSIEEMRSQAVKKGLTLNYKPLEKPIKIKSDPDRLKQILINLISNAIKFTEKGSIDVITAVKLDKFLITVADTGIGISSEDQQKLFQKFFRIRTKHTQDIIGTGLGLWISSEIVKRMQGKITVESIEGVGSHFTVCLPVVKK